MRQLLIGGLLAASLCAAESAWADKAVDPPPPSAPATVTVPFVTRTEKGAKHHKLILPKKALEGIKVSQASPEESGSQVLLAGENGRTILAGCALSMAVGSLLVFRNRKVLGAIVLATGVAAAGASSLSWADFAPGPFIRTVTIEVDPKADVVTFIEAK